MVRALHQFLSFIEVLKGTEQSTTSKGRMLLGEREMEVIGRADPEESIKTGNGVFGLGVASKV